MARPSAHELTGRELDVMHVFWRRGAATAQEARDALASAGIELSYTTVATLVRILADKGFLHTADTARPFKYRPTRDWQEVSARLLDDLVARVFHGSRTLLLKRLVGDGPLPAAERDALETLLREATP